MIPTPNAEIMHVPVPDWEELGKELVVRQRDQDAATTMTRSGEDVELKPYFLKTFSKRIDAFPAEEKRQIEYPRNQDDNGRKCQNISTSEFDCGWMIAVKPTNDFDTSP